MKKIIIPLLLAALIASVCFGFSAQSAARKEEAAKDEIIRLHIRAQDDSEEEQSLKLQVRDAILKKTGELTETCTSKQEAAEILLAHMQELTQIAQNVIRENGKNHPATVSLKREFFEYREYDGFFLPEGEYDSLIITIGAGEGHNWWCVVFPAACYVGAAEEIETDSLRMPVCFQLAKKRNTDVKIESWFHNFFKGLFE